MGDHFHIEGIPGLDGDYPLPDTEFTGRELHFIKQHAGVRAGEIEEALGAGDYDIILAIAAIAMQRAGRDVSMDALLDAPTGKIQVIVEDDARPPDLTTTEPDASSGTSGDGSSGSSDHPANGQSPTGSPASANSRSDHATSVT